MRSKKIRKAVRKELDRNSRKPRIQSNPQQDVRIGTRILGFLILTSVVLMVAYSLNGSSAKKTNTSTKITEVMRDSDFNTKTIKLDDETAPKKEAIVQEDIDEVEENISIEDTRDHGNYIDNIIEGSATIKGIVEDTKDSIDMIKNFTLDKED